MKKKFVIVGISKTNGKPVSTKMLYLHNFRALKDRIKASISYSKEMEEASDGIFTYEAYALVYGMKFLPHEVTTLREMGMLAGLHWSHVEECKHYARALLGINTVCGGVWPQVEEYIAAHSQEAYDQLLLDAKETLEYDFRDPSSETSLRLFSKSLEIFMY